MRSRLARAVALLVLAEPEVTWEARDPQLFHKRPFVVQPGVACWHTSSTIEPPGGVVTMTFVDITVVPVPEDHKASYLEFSRRMAAVYRDHGATRIVDYWQAGTTTNQDEFHADGLDYETGVLQGLAEVMGAQERESVVVTVTEWPSQEVRDRGSAAATKDPRVLATLDEDPIFDGRRLVAGTFEPVVDSLDQD